MFSSASSKRVGAAQLSVVRLFSQHHKPAHEWKNLSSRDWKKLLFWLDVSGLALPFVQILEDQNQTEQIPAEVIARLSVNRVDNSDRMEAMAAECIDLLHAFNTANLRYVLIKGFALYPHSVASFELRSQLDIDFVVAQEDLPSACHIVESRGYKLYGQHGRSWEYKDDPKPKTSIRDLYKDFGGRSVELHAADSADSQRLLDRRSFTLFRGATMPTLDAEDTFLHQALHVYKHVTREGGRTAHLVELYQHITWRGCDDTFWNSIRESTTDEHSLFALGFVVQLVIQAFGPVAESLSSWTSEALPAFAKRWIEFYGGEAVFGRFPGTKIPLILQDELERHGLVPKLVRERRILPIAWPPRIEKPQPMETIHMRVGRYWRQLRFVTMRAQFHLFEGLRYYYEKNRWARETRNMRVSAEPCSVGCACDQPTT